MITRHISLLLQQQSVKQALQVLDMHTKNIYSLSFSTN